MITVSEAEDETKRTTTRRGKGVRLLTERDQWALTWIAEQQAIRFDQLQVLLCREPGRGRGKQQEGLTRSATDQVLRRWEEEPAYVFYERMSRGQRQTGWIWLTTYAENILQLPFPQQHTLKETRLRYYYYANLARLEFERLDPKARWVSERALLAQRPRRGSGEHVFYRLPSAEIRSNSTIAVELALSTKCDEEIDQIVADHLAHYDAIWWFVFHSDPTTVQAWHVIQDSITTRLSEDFRSRVRIIKIEG
jgi:hypothetical protein